LPFDLVIFDCDGVLVDTEPASNRVLAALLTEVGLPTTYEEALERYKGRSWASCVKRIEAALGRALPPDFANRYRGRLDREFEGGLEAVPGVRETLDALLTPFCVASSGEHAKMQRTLGTTGLLPYFSGRIFSATDVARGKPAPDLFLHAAATLGFAPPSCAVIEDSPLGIEAARAAGMTPFGFAGTQTADAAALAGSGARVFAHMRELPSLLLEPC
jgi:HAD superfamily hydrolase (TIGR01509 family)